MLDRFQYTEDVFNYYSKRLPTFYTTNLNLNNCKKLTTYGFYWNSNKSRIVCHSCNQEFEERLGVKNIIKEHLEKNINCKYSQMHVLKKQTKKFLTIQDYKKCQELFGQIAMLVEKFVEVPVLVRNMIISINKFINTKKDQIVFVNERYVKVTDAWKILCGEVQINQYFLTELYLGSLGESADSMIEPLCRALSNPFSTMKKLNLRDNHFTDVHLVKLSRALRKNKMLHQLVLCCNEIEDFGVITLNYELLNFNKTLRQLDLRKNLITDEGAESFCPVIEQNYALSYLDLRENAISEQAIKSILKSLKRNYSVSYLKFSSINEELESVLDKKLLSTSKIKERNQTLFYPDFKMQIENIAESKNKILNVSFAPLGSIPHEIGKCFDLTVLVLRGINLVDCPAEIGLLTNLIMLDLSENNLSVLPNEIGLLVNLKILDVRFNKLTTLNPEIGELKLLRKLLARYNKLEFLPSQLHKCINLKKIDLFSNPMKTIPKNYLPANDCILEKKEEIEELFKYLKAIGKGKPIKSSRVKLMFVGDENVGKTSLQRALMSLKEGLWADLLDLTNKVEQSTVATDGIDITEMKVSLPYKYKQVNGEYKVEEHITFDCWDYAGQDLYYSTHQFFLSQDSMYLLIFNTLKPNTKLEYWLRTIDVRAKNSVVFLVGTHSDDKRLTSSQTENIINNLKEKFCTEFKNIVGIHIVSCTTMKGIRKLRNHIVDVAAEKNMIGKFLPQSWVDLETFVMKSREKKINQFMHWDEFVLIAKGNNIDSDDITAAVEFLNKIGKVCYFDNDKNGSDLSRWIFLDPQFLTNVMSDVITLKHRFVKEGKLFKSDLKNIWSSYPHKIHDILIELLQKFEILFKTKIYDPNTNSEKDVLLIPSLLPLEQPPQFKEIWGEVSKQKKGSWFLTEEKDGIFFFERIYTFQFLPLGFFSKLMVRVMSMEGAKPLCYYQNGVIVELAKAKCCIKYNESTHKLIIETMESNSGLILLKLVNMADTLIEGWYNTEYSITAVCPHCISEGTYNKYEFELKNCVDVITKGKGLVFCRGAHPIRVDKVAPEMAFKNLEKKIIHFEDLVLKNQIGQGAFGTVYKALYHEREVAVKIMQFGELSNKELALNAFNEFQKEVSVMSMLDHPNIVKFHGLCTEPFAIVMECLYLGNLFDLIQTKAHIITNQLGTRIAFDISKAMCLLHSINPPIIFRDLRSPNVMLNSLDLDQKVIAKLTDFGTARITHVMKGGDLNPFWTSPEVVSGKEYTTKADVYSFGIILYELLSQKEPFSEYDATYKGKPPSHFIKALLEGLRPTIPLIHKFSKGFVELIERCWESEPSKRPGFEEICQVLSELCGIKIEHENNEQALSFLVEESKMEKKSQTEPSKQMLMDPNKILLNHFIKKITPKIGSIISILTIIPGEQVWIGDSKGSITIWDVKEHRCVKHLKVHQDKISCMVRITQQTGSYNVITSSEDGTVLMWETTQSVDREKTKILPYSEGNNLIKSNESPEFLGKKLNRSSEDGSSNESKIETKSRNSFNVLLIEDYSSDSKENSSSEVEDSGVLRHTQYQSLDNSSENNRPVSRHHSKTVSEPLDRKNQSRTTFNPSYKLLANIKIHKGKAVLSIFYDPESRYLWSADADGVIMVSADNGSKVIKRLEMKEPVLCICKVNNLVWVGLNKFIQVLDSKSYTVLGRWKAHDGLVHHILWVNEEVWTCSSDCTVKVWNHLSGAELDKKEGHSSKVYYLLNAGNGQIWSCGFDATIFVWDSKTHECLRVLKGIHQDSIYCMAYVGYDEVWSGSCNSRDGSICVWSVNGLNAVLKPL